MNLLNDEFDASFPEHIVPIVIQPMSLNAEESVDIRQTTRELADIQLITGMGLPAGESAYLELTAEPTADMGLTAVESADMGTLNGRTADTYPTCGAYVVKLDHAYAALNEGVYDITI